MTKYRFTSAALSELAKRRFITSRKRADSELSFSGRLVPQLKEFCVFLTPGIHCPHEQGVAELIVFRSGCFIRIRSDEILITAVTDLRRVHSDGGICCE